MSNVWIERNLSEITLEGSPITYGVVKPGSEGNIKFIRGGDLLNGKVLNKKLRTITQSVSNQYQRTLLKGGELLICLVGMPGQTGVVTPELAGANIARQVGLIRLNEQYDVFFYSYYLQSPEGIDKLDLQESGAVQRVINLAALRSVKVPCPSHPEQKRIVAILDKAFTAIAKAKAHSEQNLINAKELFESYLQGVFENKGEEWEIKKLGDVCKFENGDRGVNYPSKAHRTESGIPFINAGHLTSDGLDISKMDYISRERYDLLGSGKVQKGDILFCLRGSLGKFAKVKEFSEGAIASSLVIVRPKLRITSEFLMAYFESKICADMIFDFGNGAAQPNLSAGSLKKFEIPLPTLPEQKRIVKKLDALSSETKKLEAIYQQKIENLEELKKSILQKAFSGQLKMEN